VARVINSTWVPGETSGNTGEPAPTAYQVRGRKTPLGEMSLGGGEVSDTIQYHHQFAVTVQHK